MKIRRGKLMGRKFALLMALVLAAAVMPAVPAVASNEGLVTGKFGLTAAPEVTTISIHELPTGEGAPGTGDPAASLTPQIECDINVTITDSDGIGELDRLVVQLWHDNYGTASGTVRNGGIHSFNYWYNQTEFDHPEAKAQLIWDRDSNTVTINPAFGVNSSWEKIEIVDTVPILPDTEDFSASSFAFTFRIKIGKIARQTVGDAKWHVGALVTDKGGMEGYLAQTGLTMNFYGEVKVEWPESYHKVEWGDIPPGIDFDASAARALVQAPIKYLANGNYNQQIKSSDTWESGEATAYLSEDAAGANHFSLKANSTANDYITAVLLGSEMTTLRDNGTATNEQGFSVNDNSNNLYIKLNQDFAKGVFTGAITYGIVNRLD